MIQLKRAYEQPEISDEYRILVDRLWPRGISKEQAQIDLWKKAVAPSNGLRKWFNHEPEKFPEFKERYIKELKTEDTKQAFQELLKLVKKHETVTLIYGAKDEIYNHAVILKELLEQAK